MHIAIVGSIDRCPDAVGDVDPVVVAEKARIQ